MVNGEHLRVNAQAHSPICALANAWNPAQAKAPAPDGLATLRAVITAMDAGLPVPERDAAHMLQALRPMLTGDNDVAGRLGLRTKRGKSHAAPIMRERLLRRDNLIHQMLECMNTRHSSGPLEASALALQVLWAWCSVPDPARPQPNKALLELAAEFEVLSVRQILRIFKNESAYHRVGH